MPNKIVTSKTRWLRAVSAVSATALVALVTGAALPASAASAATPAAAAATPTHGQVARWGAGYLARQITANGGHVNAYGFTDVVDTAYAVIGLHAAGVGKAASSSEINSVIATERTY